MAAQKEVKQHTEELHLFIIWEHARHKQDSILRDMKKVFDIEEIREVTWPKKYFAQNLTRFYGTKLPKGSAKEKRIGTGPFLLIIVRDKKPVYDTHETSRGPSYINSNTFMSKASYRDMTGGWDKIHGTNTLAETDHDLTLLLGVNAADYLASRKGKKPSARIKKMNMNLVGAVTWDSIEQIFYVLNNTVSYIVLRNFEDYPSAVYKEGHGDIDLLGKSAEELAYILNATKVFPEDHRVHYRSHIKNDEVLFDFRFVGDGYYDEKWQRAMLASSYEHPGGYMRPSDEQYYHSVAYHALLHKPEFSEDYRTRLPAIAERAGYKDATTIKAHIKNVARFMSLNDYAVTEPIDESVYKNETYYAQLRLAMKKQKVRRKVTSVFRRRK